MVKYSLQNCGIKRKRQKKELRQYVPSYQKKELNFEELIQMYGKKYSERKPNFQRKQLTFEDVWNEISTSKPVYENEYSKPDHNESNGSENSGKLEIGNSNVKDYSHSRILDKRTFQDKKYFRDKSHLMVSDTEYSGVNADENDTTEFEAFLDEIIEKTTPPLSNKNETQVNDEKLFFMRERADLVQQKQTPNLIQEIFRYQSKQNTKEQNKYNTNVDSFLKSPKTNIKLNEEESITFTSSPEPQSHTKNMVNDYQENNSRLSYTSMSFKDLIRSVKKSDNVPCSIKSGKCVQQSKSAHPKCKNFLVDVPPIETEKLCTSSEYNKQASSLCARYLAPANCNKEDMITRKLQANKQESGIFESEKDESDCLQQSKSTIDLKSRISSEINVLSKKDTNQVSFAQCLKNKTIITSDYQGQSSHKNMSFSGLVRMLQESDKRSNTLHKSIPNLNKQTKSESKQFPICTVEGNKSQELCYVNGEPCNLFSHIFRSSSEKCIDSTPQNYNCETREDEHPVSKLRSKDDISLPKDEHLNLASENFNCMSCFDSNSYENVRPTLKALGVQDTCPSQESPIFSKIKKNVEPVLQTSKYEINPFSPQKCATKFGLINAPEMINEINCKKGLFSDVHTSGVYSPHISETFRQKFDSVDDNISQTITPNDLIENFPATKKVDNKNHFLLNLNNKMPIEESKELEFSHNTQHYPVVAVLEEKLANKRMKKVNSSILKPSEEEIPKITVNISQELLENVNESHSELHLCSSARTFKKSTDSLFSKEMLESIIKSLKSHRTLDNNFENDKENYFRKDRIKRYRKGNVKIYHIKVATIKRKPLTEICNKTLDFDDVIDIMSQEFDNPNQTVEMVSLSRQASFETDATKSECLSTGSADNMPLHEKKMRRGLNIISKDKSLLFHGSDSVLCEQDKNKIIIKIQELFLQVWSDMTANKSPQIVLRRQCYENCVFNDNMLQLKPVDQAIMSTIHYNHSQSKLKFCLVMFLLNKIMLLLETNTYLTKREIYYQLKDLIAKQGLIDAAINNTSCLLNVGPWELNILAQKGLVYGDLKIRFTSGEILNCCIPGVLIPCNLNEIVEIQSQAYFILVVEKEAIYHKLLQEDLPNRLSRPFILITGKGFPDLNTQRFLKKLWIIMSIPVFILVDGDFHGINIMLNYRYGSLRNAHLSQYLAIPNAKWLGVLPSEMVKLGVKREPLSYRERGLIVNLMQSPYVLHNPDIKAELKILWENGYKGGIEGLIKNNTYLSEVYLPSKFYYQEYV